MEPSLSASSRNLLYDLSSKTVPVQERSVQTVNQTLNKMAVQNCSVGDKTRIHSLMAAKIPLTLQGLPGHASCNAHIIGMELPIPATLW